MVSLIKLRSFGWAERTGTPGEHLPSIAVCVGDVEAFWVANRIGTRLKKNTYWVLVVTRPASHDLAPQAVCQWGKLFRVMIMLSFMMCGMKPF